MGLQRAGHNGVTHTLGAAQEEFSQAGPLEGGGGSFFQVRRADEGLAPLLTVQTSTDSGRSQPSL